MPVPYRVAVRGENSVSSGADSFSGSTDCNFKIFSGAFQSKKQIYCMFNRIEYG